MTISDNRYQYTIRSVGLAWLLGMALFVVGRFGPATETFWHFDDTGYRIAIQNHPDAVSLIQTVFPHPHRLFGYVPLLLTYKAVGENASAFTALAVLGYAVLLLLILIPTWVLTRSLRVTMLTAIFHSTWPNLIESYHWPNIIMTTLSSQWAYGLSAMAWILYISKRGRGWYVLSVLAYGLGLGCYETGFALPLAFLLLVPLWRFRDMIKLVMPYAVLFGFFMLMRVTNVFGMGALQYSATHFTPNISIHGIIWTAGEYVGWWVGGHMLECISNGWTALMDLSVKPRRLLLLMDVVLAFIASWVAGLQGAGEKNIDVPVHPSLLPAWRILGFAVAWTAVCWLPMSVHIISPRLLLLPAFGISLGLAQCLSLLKRHSVKIGMLMWVFLALGANQGTALDWRETGLFEAKIMKTMRQHKAEWIDANVVLFDSSVIRERMTGGLNRSTWTGPVSLATYRNAGYLRGFTLQTILDFIRQDSTNRPRAVLDIECDPSEKNGYIYWHERFNPARLRMTLTGEVYRINLGDLMDPPDTLSPGD